MTSWRALDSLPAIERSSNSWRWFASCSSVANLDAWPVPNPPVSVPNRGASSPVARRFHIHGSGRDVDRGRCIVAGTARNRSSEQCAKRQPADNSGGHLATACHRILRRPGQANTACKQESNRKLAHFWAPPNVASLVTSIKANLTSAEFDALMRPLGLSGQLRILQLTSAPSESGDRFDDEDRGVERGGGSERLAIMRRGKQLSPASR